MEDDESEFKWGVKKLSAGHENSGSQYYESFTWNGQSVSLYECVFFYAPGALETYVGKIVKLYETPKRERKVEVVWLFRPIEIRSYLGDGDAETKWNELFLATGQGRGVTNVNDVGNIIGKCNVVCLSTDKRNPQVSKEDRRKADYIFYRTFDVGQDVISVKFPDEIAGIKVEFLFNRVNGQTITHQGLKNQVEQINISSRTELDKYKVSSVKTSTPTCAKSVPLNNQTLTRQGPLEMPNEQFNLPSRMEYNKSAVSPATNNMASSAKCAMLSGHALTHTDARKYAEQFNSTTRNEFNKQAASPTKNSMPSNGTSAMLKVQTSTHLNKQGETFNRSSQIVLKKDSRNPATMLTGKSASLKDQTVVHPDLKKRGEHVNLSSMMDSNKGTFSPAKNDMPTRHINTVVRGDGLNNGISVVGDCLNSNVSLKLRIVPAASGIQRGRDVKDMSKVRCSKVGSTESSLDGLPLKKRPKLSDGKCSSLQEGPSKANYVGQKANGFHEKSGLRLASDGAPKTCEKIVVATKRDDIDRRNWFIQLPWEEKLRKAQEAETLVLLDNLDPSYASTEVEDLVWHALRAKVEARVIEQSTVSNPLYGKALVIFKSKVAAENAIRELNRRYLILADGRPVCARRRNLREPSDETNFFGHLVLDRHRFRRQSFDTKNAVSTAHCSQPNSMEYDFALQWLELQEKSDLQWKALYKEQLKDITEAKSRLKHNRSD